MLPPTSACTVVPEPRMNAISALIPSDAKMPVSRAIHHGAIESVSVGKEIVTFSSGSADLAGAAAPARHRSQTRAAMKRFSWMSVMMISRLNLRRLLRRVLELLEARAAIHADAVHQVRLNGKQPHLLGR